MPDFDTGHIFLTTLAPIKRSEPGDSTTSYSQKIRVKLAEMQPARQSPATYQVHSSANAQETWANSPFSRNCRNHLTRLFVMDDVVYNGRPGGSAIAAALSGDNPLVAKEVDHLNCAYLVFSADIDAVLEDGAPLPESLTTSQQKEVRRSYAIRLWETMGDDLLDLYSNCVGFNSVNTADGFADYLEECHVETTMPFHDYFSTQTDSKTLAGLPQFPLGSYVSIGKWLGIGALIAAAVFVIGLLLYFLATIGSVINAIFGTSILTNLLTGTAITSWFPWAVLALLLLLFFLALLVFIGIRRAMKGGQKPWPHAEYDDLPSVLKALYTQQHFSQFMIDSQGVEDAVLHKNFGDFLTQHKPDNKQFPSQAPGVISSSIEGGTVHGG